MADKISEVRWPKVRQASAGEGRLTPALDEVCRLPLDTGDITQEHFTGRRHLPRRPAINLGWFSAAAERVGSVLLACFALNKYSQALLQVSKLWYNVI